MNYPTTARRYGNTAGQMNTKEDIAAELAGRSADTPVSAAQPSQTQQQLASGLAQKQTDGNAMTGGSGNAMTKPRTNTVTGNAPVTLPNGVNAAPNGGQIMYQSGNYNSDANNNYIGSNYTYPPQSYGGQIMGGVNVADGTSLDFGSGKVMDTLPTYMTAAQAAAQRAAASAQPQSYPNGYTTQLPNGPQLTGNGATVYSGGAAYTPEGQTYGDNVQRAAGLASGDIVRLRDYADSQGLGNIIDWDDGTKTAFIGGVPIPYEYISDGRAYVKKALVDSMIEQYRRNANANSPAGITDTVMDRHQSAINRALNKVVNRTDWSYDPAKDPAYTAYARQYAENAERAYNRAMGSGGLYGSPNSYQYYQALAGYGDNMQKLSDMVPTLAQQDYGRYSDEQARNRAALEAVQSERNADLSARYNATMAQLAQQRAANETDYQRTEDSKYNYPYKQYQNAAAEQNVYQQGAATREALNQAMLSDMYTGRYGELLDTDIESRRAQLTGLNYQNTEQFMKNMETEALITGHYRPEHMQMIGVVARPELANTTGYDSNGYPLPGTPAAIMQLNAWLLANKQITKDTWSINNGMG